jgi:hypothetical protein
LDAFPPNPREETSRQPPITTSHRNDLLENGISKMVALLVFALHQSFPSPILFLSLQ